MQLAGSRGQEQRDHYYFADSTITVGGTSQLLLPERKSTSFLMIQNNSTGAIWIEFGGARATVSISGAGPTGTLNAFTVTNGGFNYSLPPKVVLLGGGSGGNNLSPGATLPTWPSPGDPGFAAPRQGSNTAYPGKAHAVLSAGVVTSIVVDDPGSGYVVPPYVLLENNILDPNGVADPHFAAVNSGLQLGPSGGNYYVNGTHCPTDAIAIWGATGGQAFSCRWAQ
jgi:hypothetical protein